MKIEQTNEKGILGSKEHVHKKSLWGSLPKIISSGENGPPRNVPEIFPYFKERSLACGGSCE